MSDAFRELLRKIGSGAHTGKDLSRAEAKAATQMLLQQEATPAQIGAFLIAHRIKRPTGEELAGMLDAYDQLGPKLQPIDAAAFRTAVVTIFGSPYDGRSRTAPISLLSALILNAAGCPVLLHGGDRMPTKYGTPLIDFWQGLGVDWTRLSLADIQQIFAQTGLGFIYLPTHFPLANNLVPYRDQIGKRPPLATLELIWTPYRGQFHLIAGFVHPPTEHFIREAMTLRGTQCFTTVKGSEGSCDLPRSRTAIIGCSGTVLADGVLESPAFERLHLHPHDYGFSGKDVPLESTPTTVQAMQSVLRGEASPLMQSALWNGGFYLWRCGAAADLSAGIALAQSILTQGQGLEALQCLSRAIAALRPLVSSS